MSVLVGVCCAWSFVVSLLHLSHSIFKARSLEACARIEFGTLYRYHSLNTYITGPALPDLLPAVFRINPVIRQTAGGLSAARCPSPGRRGGLCSGFRGRSGTLVCRYRSDAVSCRRSVAQFLAGTSAGSPGGMADMLVDQHYPDILPLRCKLVKGGLDGGVFCLAIYDQEVLLVVWRRRDVLGMVSVLCGPEDRSRTGTHPDAGQKQPRDGVLIVGATISTHSQ